MQETVFDKYYKRREQPQLFIAKLKFEHFVPDDDYKLFIENYYTTDITIGLFYFLLWNIEEVFDANEDYQIQKYLPNCFAIGTNLGGELIGIDFDQNNRIVICPLGDLDKESCIGVAKSFTDFFAILESGKDIFAE